MLAVAGQMPGPPGWRSHDGGSLRLVDMYRRPQIACTSALEGGRSRSISAARGHLRTTFCIAGRHPTIAVNITRCPLLIVAAIGLFFYRSAFQTACHTSVLVLSDRVGRLAIGVRFWALVF